MWRSRLPVFVLLSSLASASFACSGGGMEPEYAVKYIKHDAVVLGRVQETAYTGVHEPDVRPWRGTVRLLRVLRGRTQEKLFSIGGSGSSAACDTAPPPTAGDVCVLYLLHEEQSDRVVLSLPVVTARLVDRRIKHLLPHSENGER